VSGAHQGLILTLQLLLVLPLLWQLGRFLIDARQLFSPTTVVAGGFAGLYVSSYYLVSSHDRDAFLTVDGYLGLLLLAVLAVYVFWAGFVLGCGGALRHRPPVHEWAICWYAVALIGIGFAAQAAFIAKSGGFFAFYGAPHGVAGAWAETSAYLYSLSLFMFPAMCLLCGLLVRAGLPGWSAPIALLAAVLYSAFDAFVFGSRGDTIRLFLLLLLPPLFLAGRVRPIRRLGILLATSVAMTAVLLYPYLRDAVHLGAEKSLVQAVTDVFSDEPVRLDPPKGTGHELFYAAGVVEAASEQGAYHYGFGWAYPFVNLVPRAWWSEKPYGAEWAIDRARLIQQHAGWTVGHGAASTGVADAFLAFSWFSLAVWLAFGWWGGVIWARAATTDSVIDVASLWAFLMITVYFVNQGYNAAWHAWLFHMVPLWFLSFLMPIRVGRSEPGQDAFASARAQPVRMPRTAAS
jgi:hypothetical protein